MTKEKKELSCIEKKGSRNEIKKWRIDEVERENKGIKIESKGRMRWKEV